MKKPTSCIAAATLFIVLASGAWGQNVSSQSPVTFWLPPVGMVPPVEAGMPEDVSSAYCLLHTIARTTPDYQEGRRMINRIGPARRGVIGAAISHAMDYDPLLFTRFLATWPGENYYRFGPDDLVYAVRSAITPLNEKMMFDMEEMPEEELQGLDLRTRLLLRNPIVAHLRVDTMRMFIDSLAAFAVNAVGVSATILDPIQGRRIPLCGRMGTIETDTSSASYLGQPALPGACLQFQYRTQWAGFRGVSDMITDDSVDWVHPGGEYIVFLGFTDIGAGTDDHYYTTSPTGQGWSVGMYPIIDGKVNDMMDDFGFGKQVPVEEFKARLRAVISRIRAGWNGFDCGSPFDPMDLR